MEEEEHHVSQMLAGEHVGNKLPHQPGISLAIKMSKFLLSYQLKNYIRRRAEWKFFCEVRLMSRHTHPSVYANGSSLHHSPQGSG